MPLYAPDLIPLILLGGAGTDSSTPAAPAWLIENPAILSFGLIKLFGFPLADFWASPNASYSFCAILRAKSVTFAAFSGRLNHIELRKAYREAQFHFQLSLFEGFGLSLCEAMLCECIPIGSSVNMIPQIIGDTGFILNQKKIDLLIDIMKKAIATTNKEDLGKKARQRIVENFNESIRRELLINCVNNMH